MPYRRCAICNRQGELLKESSKDAEVEYYVCSACHFLWFREKPNPDGPPKPVTPPNKLELLTGLLRQMDRRSARNK
jgi:hypothetical protein